MKNKKLSEEELPQLIDSSPGMQKLIDEINEVSDAEDGDEEECSSRVNSPFATEGTIYDGATGENVSDVREGK